ncbi:MAG: 4Fe-4S dicluster domain-containing protein [Bacillota bacterium]
MRVTRHGEELRTDPCFAERIRNESEQPIELCYHCQKCASGCLPMGMLGGTTPNQLLRMINLGLKEQVLKSPGIWICTACETCGARCPNGISIAAVMDAVRETAHAENVAIAGDSTLAFHRLFLGDIKSRGRISESLLMAKFKLKTGRIFSDMDLGLKLFLRGKLPLIPKGIKEKQRVRKMFDSSEEKIRIKYRPCERRQAQ